MRIVITALICVLGAGINSQAAEKGPSDDLMMKRIASIVNEHLQNIASLNESIRVVDASDFADNPSLAEMIAKNAFTAFRLSRISDGTTSMDPTIYIIRTSEVYQRAGQGRKEYQYFLASSVAHEITHGKGGTELDALKVQQGALYKLSRSFGNSPDETNFLLLMAREVGKKIKAEGKNPTKHPTLPLRSANSLTDQR